MAATITPTVVRVRSIGDVFEAVYSVAISGTYTDNGDALSFATLGVNQVDWADCTPAVDSPVTGMWNVYYDIANQKVVLFAAVDATPAANEALPEIAAGTTIGTRTFRLCVHGKGSVRGPAA